MAEEWERERETERVKETDIENNFIKILNEKQSQIKNKTTLKQVFIYFWKKEKKRKIKTKEINLQENVNEPNISFFSVSLSLSLSCSYPVCVFAFFLCEQCKSYTLASLLLC